MHTQGVHVSPAEAEKPVTFNWRDGHLLGVYHQVPDPQAPGVFYIHGLPGDRTDARRLPVRMARRFQSRGIAGLRVDLYASGVSEGEFYRVTFSDELEQILFLVKEIRFRSLWQGPIILLGYSQAAKLILAAVQQKADIAGMCFWSGILTPEVMAGALIPKATTGNPQSLRRAYRKDKRIVLEMGYGQWIATELLQQIRTFSPGSEMLSPLIPNHAIYGGRDDSTRDSLDLLQQEGFDITLIPDADHLFTNSEWELQLMRATEDWVCATFC